MNRRIPREHGRSANHHANDDVQNKDSKQSHEAKENKQTKYVLNSRHLKKTSEYRHHHGDSDSDKENVEGKGDERFDSLNFEDGQGIEKNFSDSDEESGWNIGHENNEPRFEWLSDREVTNQEEEEEEDGENKLDDKDVSLFIDVRSPFAPQTSKHAKRNDSRPTRVGLSIVFDVNYRLLVAWLLELFYFL